MANKKFESDIIVNGAIAKVGGLATQFLKANGTIDANIYEVAFTKNTAFNKNFGTTTTTVAEGNDFRILNGQTAFTWGNHAGVYLPLAGGTLTGNLKGPSAVFGSNLSFPTTINDNGITFNNRQVSTATYPSSQKGFTWDISSDGAWMKAYEMGSDMLEYEFGMSDNIGSSDRFVWKMNSWTGIYNGIEATVLIPGGSFQNNQQFLQQGNVTLGVPKLAIRRLSDLNNTLPAQNATYIRNNSTFHNPNLAGSTLVLTANVAGFTGTTSAGYVIKIKNAVTIPNTFCWSINGNQAADVTVPANWTGNDIACSTSPITLNNGVTITFNATSGGVLNETIGFTVLPGSTVLNTTGTAALPSYTFNGDNNTGMYQVSSDILGLSTGGTQRARLDGNGITVTGNVSVEAGNDLGFRFWGSGTTYSIGMGVGASYQYGPVTDYSIKHNMAGGINRGFTWGQFGVAPVAALNSTSGNFQTAGSIESASATITELTGTGSRFVMASATGVLSAGTNPTTISGYGITDFNSLGDARWSLLAHTHAYSSLTGIPATFTPSSHTHAWADITSGNPTTIAGYGITDFNSLGDARWSALSHVHAYSSLTGIPVSFAPSAHTLDSHSNVTITANTNGELLRWNGTAWINNTLAEAGIQAAGSYLTGTKVDSFNTRTGVVTLTKDDVEAVLTGGITTHTHTNIQRLNDNRATMTPLMAPTSAISTTFSTQGAMASQVNDSDYSDVLILNSYQDSSAGQVNALSFDKSSYRINHFTGVVGGATWTGYKTLAYTDDSRFTDARTPLSHTHSLLTRGTYLTGGNYDGGAVQTWAVDATTAATASKIVARDTNGFVFGVYFNSSNGAEATAATNYNYDIGDGYIRRKSLANVRTEIVTSAAVVAGLGFTPVSGSAHLPLAGGVTTGRVQMYVGDITGTYSTRAIELREVGLVGATQTGAAYAPSIGFHWGGLNQLQLAMLSTGSLVIRTDAGTGNAIYHAGNLTNLNQLANGPGYTTNVGTVTSVVSSGGYGGLTLSGTNAAASTVVLGGTPTGTWPISISGNAATANYATYIPTAYSGGQQLNPQTYFGMGTGLKVAMTAAAGVWSDTLWINGYSGSDVKSMCALHFQRNGTPRAYISTQLSDSITYGAQYEILSTYNMGSHVLPLTGGTMSGSITAPTFIGALSGNATTATTATNVAWTGITGKEAWLSNTSLIGSHPGANDPRNSGFYENDGGGTNWPSASWYNSINVRHSNQANMHGFQAAMSYYDNKFWFRSYQGAGSFQAWEYAVSNANIGTFAPSLTGAGASGTWNINITGTVTTAVNANNVAFTTNNVLVNTVPLLWGNIIGPTSGNAPVVITDSLKVQPSSGSIYANKFVANGGTATQYLMANGSVTTGGTWDAGSQGYSLVSTAGYQKFSNGMILQWASLSSGSTTYTFPLAWPNVCLSIVLSTNRTNGGSLGTNHYGNLTKTQYYAVIDGTNGKMFSIGY